MNHHRELRWECEGCGRRVCAVTSTMGDDVAVALVRCRCGTAAYVDMVRTDS